MKSKRHSKKLNSANKGKYWKEIENNMKTISKKVGKINLTKFIILDRLKH